MSNLRWPTGRQPRVPFAPLLEAFELAELSLPEVARRAGLNWAGLCRDRKAGTVTVWRADHLSVAVLNRHPAEIYGDDWLDRDALDDPIVDFRIRALHESWQLRHELRQTG